MLKVARSAPEFGKRAVVVVWDFGAWLVAVPIALSLRFDLGEIDLVASEMVGLGFALGLLQVGIGSLTQVYRGRYRVGSAEEAVAVTLSTALVGLTSTSILVILHPPGVPRSVAAIASLTALPVMLAGRFAWRDLRIRSTRSKDGLRTLVYGAGDAGEQAIRLMKSDPTGEFHAVGLLDDDKSKRRLRLLGVPVLGTADELVRIIHRTRASVLVVAIAAIDVNQLRALDQVCQDQGVQLRSIPSAAAIITGGMSLHDISEVKVEDLLGRNPTVADIPGVPEFLRGKRVLITGAGGSIGAELARQVNRYSPSTLVLVDRDESALLELQLSLKGHGLLNSSDYVLADIRDRERVEEVFDIHSPEVVFHAAALKHLPLLESYPSEALKTNVLGSINVFRAASNGAVQTLVNISTDKAADPSSVLGRSKYITERLAAGFADVSGTRFLSVRFGNVLGSRGSVMHTFRAQIESGGPLTVTDPEVTRYFMTIPEAVHLVLQAAVIAEPGNTLILDMGEPVRIADVARKFIAKSGSRAEIAYVGLRPGEKLHETLFSSDETVRATEHRMISMTQVSAIDVDVAVRRIHFADSALTAMDLLSRETSTHEAGTASESSIE